MGRRPKGAAPMLVHFRTYQLSIQFNRATSKVSVPGHLRNQLLRAASSVTLNLGEVTMVGSGLTRRKTPAPPSFSNDYYLTKGAI